MSEEENFEDINFENVKLAREENLEMPGEIYNPGEQSPSIDLKPKHYLSEEEKEKSANQTKPENIKDNNKKDISTHKNKDISTLSKKSKNSIKNEKLKINKKITKEETQKVKTEEEKINIRKQNVDLLNREKAFLSQIEQLKQRQKEINLIHCKEMSKYQEDDKLMQTRIKSLSSTNQSMKTSLDMLTNRLNKLLEQSKINASNSNNNNDDKNTILTSRNPRLSKNKNSNYSNNKKKLSIQINTEEDFDSNINKNSNKINCITTVLTKKENNNNEKEQHLISLEKKLKINQQLLNLLIRENKKIKENYEKFISIADLEKNNDLYKKNQEIEKIKLEIQRLKPLINEHKECLKLFTTMNQDLEDNQKSIANKMMELHQKNREFFSLQGKFSLANKSDEEFYNKMEENSNSNKKKFYNNKKLLIDASISFNKNQVNKNSKSNTIDNINMDNYKKKLLQLNHSSSRYAIDESSRKIVELFSDIELNKIKGLYKENENEFKNFEDKVKIIEKGNEGGEKEEVIKAKEQQLRDEDELVKMDQEQYQGKLVENETMKRKIKLLNIKKKQQMKKINELEKLLEELNKKNESMKKDNYEIKNEIMNIDFGGGDVLMLKDKESKEKDDKKNKKKGDGKNKNEQSGDDINGTEEKNEDEREGGDIKEDGIDEEDKEDSRNVIANKNEPQLAKEEVGENKELSDGDYTDCYDDSEDPK